MKSLAALFPLPALVAVSTLAALSLGNAACAVELEQQTRPAAGFHRIEIDGEVNVTLVQGATESVTVEAPASSLARIRTTVSGSTLLVDVVESRSIWQWFSGRSASRIPRVTIRLRDVDRIEAAGAVTLDADSLKAGELRLDLAGACTLRIRDLQATTLHIDGSGATKIAIGGKVGRQKVDLSGAGSYQAEKLASDEAVIEVSGAGKAVVNARNALAIDISGAGKVEYLGDPKIKQSISGFGKVARREPS
jgi:putative autotransporter adhesin-like protein